MVRGHIEGPKHFLHFETFAVGWGQKSRDAVTVTRLTAGSSEDQIVFGFMNTSIPGFGAVDNPLVAVAHRCRFHMRGIRP